MRVLGVTSLEMLSRSARRALHSGRLVVSVASLWEITIKSKSGKLPVTSCAQSWAEATAELKAEIIAIRADHVLAVEALPELHKDPLDRILIAQAQMEKLALITNDEWVSLYPVAICW